MRRIRVGGRWSSQFLRPKSRPCIQSHNSFLGLSRHQSTAVVAQDEAPSAPESITQQKMDYTKFPSPPPFLAPKSAKLAALHARLLLPPKFPIQTLGRTLIHSSADSAPDFNNTSMANLGNDLLAYWTSEHIICRWPRLPIAVIQAAMWAYIGPAALTVLCREWGVEPAAEPGGEVDPGYLQFKRLTPGSELKKTEDGSALRPGEDMGYRKTSASSIVYDNEFGEAIRVKGLSGRTAEKKQPDLGVSLETAAAAFVRATFGALYLHSGRSACKGFFKSHVLSRQLDMASLFSFRYPSQELSRLCAREGFENPTARLISETGRHSRHPVFIVGVYSGKDKLGEAAGASLDEAKTRAAAAALKGWYLYQPLEVRVPSETEDPIGRAKGWTPVMVDGGEVLV
jgi:dsRNA-specific ribonuclease